MHDVTSFGISCAERVRLGWTQRRNDRAGKHRADLLAATQLLLEKELNSDLASGASPVLGDDANAEQDIPVNLYVHDSPESGAGHGACGLGSKKRRLVSVEDYPWQFVSPQLLDSNGQEILFPVEDDRARKLDRAVDHHRYLAERDLDCLQAFSLDLVRRVKQSMAKEKFCCFCLARKEHEANERLG